MKIKKVILLPASLLTSPLLSLLPLILTPYTLALLPDLTPLFLNLKLHRLGGHTGICLEHIPNGTLHTLAVLLDLHAVRVHTHAPRTVGAGR